MAIRADTIDHVTLEHLVEAGAIRGASIVGQPGGWGVVIQIGMTERALAAKRGAVRIFRKFETLVAYLKDIGIASYQVDASRFDPVALKTARTRTDSAERLKNAHKAASYKGWLTQQIQEAIDDPRPSVPQARVAVEWATERAALVKRAKSMES
ncbi:MAG: antitoxin PaaA2 family protein [Polaromonas sp.]